MYQDFLCCSASLKNAVPTLKPWGTDTDINLLTKSGLIPATA